MSIQILRLLPHKTGKGISLTEDYLNVASGSIPSMFKSFEKMVRVEYSEDERNNVFYTLNHNGTRKRQTFISAEAICFDIDKINIADIDLYVSHVAEATGTDANKCGVVATGNGIHYVILLHKEITDFEEFRAQKKHYKYWCKRIQDSLESSGLIGKVDTSVYDHGRILRVPYTQNIKPMVLSDRKLVEKYGTEEQKATEVIIKDATMMNANIIQQNFKLQTAASDAWQETKKQRKDDYGKPDKDYILNQCEFLKFAKDNHADFEEPLWYASLGVTAFLQDDFETAHLYSKDHAGYDFDSTQKKLEYSLSATGPRSCENINDLWDRCGECSHFGKCTTPLQLKAEDFIATEETGFTKIVKGKTVYAERDLLAHVMTKTPLKYIGELCRFMVYEDNFFKSVHKEWPKSLAEIKFLPKPDKDTVRMSFLNLCKAAGDTPLDFITDHTKKSGLINLENGIINISTGNIIPHDPKWGFTYKLPYSFNAAVTTCPTWDLFMQNFTLGRQHLIDCIEEFIGYTLSGMDYTYNTALILSGKGANGKSTLVNFMQALVGEMNCSSVSIKNVEKDLFLAASLEGKLLNVSEEESPESFRETGVFKKITGDGTIQVRQLYERGYDMRNRAKLVLTFNQMPYLGDTTPGMLRRLLIVPCDLNTDTMPDKVIANIGSKLLAEREGVLNRCIKAYQRLVARKGFLYPKETAIIVDNMVNSSSPIMDWINTFVLITEKETDTATMGQCFKSFVAMNDGSTRIKSRNFMQRLEAILESTPGTQYLLTKTGNSVSRKITGIKLLEDDSEMIDSGVMY